MNVLRKIHVLFLILLIGFKASAIDMEAGFEAANKLYEEGKYADAAHAYQNLINSGMVSEALYFNCGNAWFKLGKTGNAIASYREARRLAPRDPDLKTNLQFVRTRARGGDPYPTDRLKIFLTSLSLNEWTLLTCAALWAVCGLLTLGQWRPEQQPQLQRYVIIASVAAVLLGIGFGLALQDDLAQTAIVVVGETDLRNGPLVESKTVFKVREGAELQVVDQKDGWLQLRDAAQRTGWVREDQVILFPQSLAAKSKS